MTTPLSDERLAELRRLAALGLRAHVPCTVPAQALTDLLDEVERLRARVAELEGQDARWQVMVDRIAGQSADYLLRAREAERRIAELVAVLREVEWSGAEVLTVAGYPPSVVAVCPICQKPKKSGRHYSDCALDAALREDE